MKVTAFFFFAGCLLVAQLSCSKFGNTLPPPPPDPCFNLNMGLSGNVTNPSTSGAADGSIAVTAAIANGYSYSINNSPFQASGNFNNLSAGNYTIKVRNTDGCSETISFVLTNPVPSCSGVTIVVSASATGNDPCGSGDGTVSATATGGAAPYAFSLNGGVYQTNPVFTNLTSGSYTILARDANGCIGSSAIVVGNQPAGPLFTQVRTLIRSNCLYCHGPVLSNGINLNIDCNIVTGKDRIKARAVDGLPTPMPQSGLLPAADRQKIIDWINAGGRFTN
ncbi:MAG: hypothetical protein NTW29_10790 [Bacteroidetes bacterium]|nr:hypothetical protein [Bacteroidota bacterium]